MINWEKSRIAGIVVLSLLLCGLFGCGADTTADMNARDEDRSREQANHLAEQYKLAEGLYQGATPSADVYLKVKETPVSTAGASSETATLTGSLVLIPKIATVVNNAPVQNTYTFNNGIFDKHTGVLAFNVEQTGNTSTVSCKADKSMNFSCSWDVSWSQKLNLKKTNAQSISELRVRSNSDFVYTGSADGLNYVLQFESGTIVRPGSQVPQPAIFGYLTEFNSSLGKAIPAQADGFTSYNFEDASYDSLNDAINIVLNDDIKTKVNCSILDSGKLDCRVLAMAYHEVILQKTVRK